MTFAEVVARVRALEGHAVSVAVYGNEAAGPNTVMEATGTLRIPGDDPEDPEPTQSVHMFTFEEGATVFYLDVDAFVSAWGVERDRYLRITTTFGAIEFAGPIRRPDWLAPGTGAEPRCRRGRGCGRRSRWPSR